jgi:hypothetical protein
VAFGALLLWSGLRRRLSGKLAVHGVGREVEAVRPAYRAELVHCDLAEYRFVPQRLENLPSNSPERSIMPATPSSNSTSSRYCESGAKFTTRGII